MIYSHKPQRSGKSITANTNNPPQDPPPPKIDTLLNDVTPPPTTLDNIPKIPHISEIPDIFIEDTTPSVPEVCIEEPIPKQIPTQKTPTQKTPTQKTPTQKKIQKKIPKQTPRVSLFRRFITKILRIFGRK